MVSYLRNHGLIQSHKMFPSKSFIVSVLTFGSVIRVNFHIWCDVRVHLHTLCAECSVLGTVCSKDVLSPLGGLGPLLKISQPRAAGFWDFWAFSSVLLVFVSARITLF